MKGIVEGLHHVQVTMPPGAEDVARAFYAGVLGLEEIEKPAVLGGRGGCWFALGADGDALHIGTEKEFRPARKAHPALRVAAGSLNGLRAALLEAGRPVHEEIALPGLRRFSTDDPFGNRLELLEILSSK